MDRRTAIVRIVWRSFAGALLAVSGCAAPTGLLKSRWAMDDPDYADKYCDGAAKSDVAGKIKQAADARFLYGREGQYVGGGANLWGKSRGAVAAVDIGHEVYARSYATGYWSVSV